MSVLSPAIPLAETPARPAGAQAQTFTAFYSEHLAFVWRNVRHQLGFDANVDDVVQEVFLVVASKLDEFDGRSVRPWLYSILRRVAANQRRAIGTRKIRDSVNLEEMAARDSGPHRKAEKAEAYRVLFAMIDQLDENKKEVYILTEIEQMSAPQIAEALGINVTTVAARLRDARRELCVIAQRQRRREDDQRTGERA